MENCIAHFLYAVSVQDADLEKSATPQGAAAAPACYQDVQCALRYLHANASLLNIDPNRIFVIGQSAGGHLSALCATLGDGVMLKTGGWEDASSKIAAAIAVAGPFELEPDDGESYPWVSIGSMCTCCRNICSFQTLAPFLFSISRPLLC